MNKREAKRYAYGIALGLLESALSCGGVANIVIQDGVSKQHDFEAILDACRDLIDDFQERAAVTPGDDTVVVMKGYASRLIKP